MPAPQAAAGWASNETAAPGATGNSQPLFDFSDNYAAPHRNDRNSRDGYGGGGDHAGYNGLAAAGAATARRHYSKSVSERETRGDSFGHDNWNDRWRD